MENLRVSYSDSRIQKLFEHARDSIEMGVADFFASRSDSRRIMTSIRNADSGMELLCKVYLGMENFDAILEKRDVDHMVSNSRVHSIGMKKIRNKFKDLKIDIAPFVSLRDYRDEIEHLYPEDREVARQHLVCALEWAIDFMTNQLQRKPQDDFSPHIWDEIVHEREIMADEYEEMEDSFSELELPHLEMSELVPYHFKCPDCRSMIVKVVKSNKKDGNWQFECRHCKKQFSYDELVEAVYPNCICKFCDNPLEIPEEMSVFSETGYCGHCEYMLSKDD